MTRNVKIGLGIGILGVSVGAYFLIQYLILRKRYSTTLPAPDAAILIQQKTSNVDDTIIPDDITDNADAQKGTEVDDNGLSYSNSLREADILTGMGDY